MNNKSAFTPAASGIRAMRMSGVSPIASVMESKILPRPGRCCNGCDCIRCRSDNEVGTTVLRCSAFKFQNPGTSADIFDRHFVKFFHQFFLE